MYKLICKIDKKEIIYKFYTSKKSIKIKNIFNFPD